MASTSKNIGSEPVGGGVLSKFDQWVAEGPTKCAVVYEDEELTYSELDHRSRQLASNLIKYGVDLEDIVAFCFPKSLHAVIAMIAILRCGAAFTALPPDAPKVRKNEILAACKPKVLLCGENQEGKFVDINIPIIPVGDHTYGQHVPAVVFPTVSNINAACVLFTSGSTGSMLIPLSQSLRMLLLRLTPEPKGVVYEHGNILFASQTWGEHVGIGPHSRVLQWCSFTFGIVVPRRLVLKMILTSLCLRREHRRDCCRSHAWRLHLHAH